MALESVKIKAGLFERRLLGATSSSFSSPMMVLNQLQSSWVSDSGSPESEGSLVDLSSTDSESPETSFLESNSPR